MEIVTVERKAFETMLDMIHSLSDKLATLQRRCDGKRLEEWLSGEEVCERLRISQRTLQALRCARRIGYTQMNRNFYYRTSDVRNAIPMVGDVDVEKKGG